MPVSPGSFQNRSAISFAVSVTLTLVPSSYVNGPAPARKSWTGTPVHVGVTPVISAHGQSAAVNDHVIAAFGGAPGRAADERRDGRRVLDAGARGREYGVSVTRWAASS